MPTQRMKSELKILFIEDHPLTLLGTQNYIRHANIPGFQEIALFTGTSQKEALHLMKQEKFDLLILDLQLPDGHGYEVARKCLQADPELRILLFSGETHHFSQDELMKLGVRGYISKTMPPSRLIEAMLTIYYGGFYLPQRTETGRLESPPPVDAITPRLSLRESQVLKQLALDRTKHEIARQLGISVRTVETYRTRLMQKINCRSVVGLLRYALEHGVVD